MPSTCAYRIYCNIRQICCSIYHDYNRFEISWHADTNVHHKLANFTSTDIQSFAILVDKDKFNAL